MRQRSASVGGWRTVTGWLAPGGGGLVISGPDRSDRRGGPVRRRGVPVGQCPTDERRTITGWLAPGGGGLVISGPL